MKKILRLLMAAALIFMPITLSAQTENPRGIYKMTTLIGKHGEIEAPIEQYKICTDSITLTFYMRLFEFNIVRNDSSVFNYTGEKSKSEEDKTALIYDSDNNHFTLKWWSPYPNSPYFPYNDWCIEKYEANRFTEYGRMAFDALTAANTIEKKEPLLGTWRIIGYLDNLHNIQKELQILHDEDDTECESDIFYTIFAPGILASIRGNEGSVVPVKYNGKKAYNVGESIHSIKWISNDCIAIEENIDNKTEWQILERVTGEQSMLSRIASCFISDSASVLR